MSLHSRPVKIKFCGIRREADIALVNRYRPDYIGLIFAAGKRQVTPERALELIDRLDAGIDKVGVFVNEDPRRIADLVRDLRLDVVQLHGDETLSTWQALRSSLPAATQIWQRLGISSDPDLARSQVAAHNLQLAYYQADPAFAAFLPDGWLLDTVHQGQTGGTGHSFDWPAAQALQISSMRICAGGLNPQNVAQAIEALSPDIVDCSSGIERHLEKQSDLMADFIQAVEQMKGSIV